MLYQSKPSKPGNIYAAEAALMLWTFWACVFGIIDTQRSMGDINQILDQLSGVLETEPGSMITSQQLMKIAYVSYALIAAVSVYFVRKLDQGKEWARSSFLWGLIIQVGIMLFPPYKQPLEYITDIPDIGLQIFAMTQLYCEASNRWFDSKPSK